MLADPAFCDMVHSIGVASLCADDPQIWHLTKIYWYTVEFGVVQEGDEMKAFGAGVTRSFLFFPGSSHLVYHSHSVQGLKKLIYTYAHHMCRDSVQLRGDEAHAHWECRVCAI